MRMPFSNIISILPCWRHGCPGNQHYEKTIVSPKGREALVYSCTDCDHRVEIAPDEVSDYCSDLETDGLKLILKNALARVSFDADGVHIFNDGSSRIIEAS